jgi:hypothetical protein
MQELVGDVPVELQSLNPVIELSRSLDRVWREMRQALETLEGTVRFKLEHSARAAYTIPVAEFLESAAYPAVEALVRSANIGGISDIAASLQHHLGQRVTAYLSGTNDPKMVGRWARSKAKPRELAELRLRAAYPPATLISAAYGSDTARAWFFGTNSRLGDEAPAYLLRHGEPPFRDLLPAARAFVEGELP